MRQATASLNKPQKLHVVRGTNYCEVINFNKINSQEPVF
jgi:hypothetical protein